MKKILSVFLIAGGLLVGYLGVHQFQKSTNSAEVLGIELSVNDEGGQETGIVKIILAVALLGSGTYLLSKKS